MSQRSLSILILAFSIATHSAEAAEIEGGIQAQINGLQVTLDAETGGILEMECAGIKTLEAPHARASLLDAAYPGYGFEPL
jgi:hypothetical protein